MTTVRHFQPAVNILILPRSSAKPEGHASMTVGFADWFFLHLPSADEGKFAYATSLLVANERGLGLLDFFGSELAIFTELFNPQGAWGFPEPTTADPLLVQFFLSSIAPIKPADVEPQRMPLSKAERASFEIPKELKEILIGLCLGDLFVEKQKGCVNVCLRFEQSIIHSPEPRLNFFGS